MYWRQICAALCVITLVTWTGDSVTLAHNAIDELGNVGVACVGNIPDGEVGTVVGLGAEFGQLVVKWSSGNHGIVASSLRQVLCPLHTQFEAQPHACLCLHACGMPAETGAC